MGDRSGLRRPANDGRWLLGEHHEGQKRNADGAPAGQNANHQQTRAT